MSFHIIYCERNCYREPANSNSTLPRGVTVSWKGSENLNIENRAWDLALANVLKLNEEASSLPELIISVVAGLQSCKSRRRVTVRIIARSSINWSFLLPLLTKSWDMICEKLRVSKLVDSIIRMGRRCRRTNT